MIELGEIGHRVSASGKRGRLEYRFRHYSLEEAKEQNFTYRSLINCGPKLDLSALEIHELVFIRNLMNQRIEEVENEEEVE